MEFINFALYMVIGACILVPAISLCVLIILNGWLELETKRRSNALKNVSQLGEILSKLKAGNDS